MSFNLIPAPYGSVVFCDDIREEVSGKVTLVGCYGADLVVGGEVPAILPKLCMSCRIIFDPFDGEKILTLIIALPGETLESANIKNDVPVSIASLGSAGNGPSDPNYPRYMALINVIGGPITLNSEGIIQVFIVLDGVTTRIGVVKVRSISQ